MMDEQGLLGSPAIILAVDPGLSGAVCCLGQGKLELRRDFKKLSDIADGIYHFASKQDIDYAVMELVHAMPGQGVCSMFSFGRAAGVADGAFALALPGLEVEQVAPQKWQNFYRRELAIPREQEFDSRALASKIFPSFAPYFKRVKDHNSADAVLMAAWKQVQLCAPMSTPLVRS